MRKIGLVNVSMLRKCRIIFIHYNIYHDETCFLLEFGVLPCLMMIYKAFFYISAPGHSGRLVIGNLQGHCVVCMQGRLHVYEGYNIRQVHYYYLNSFHLISFIFFSYHNTKNILQFRR